ncbi:MAG TPA: DEAD/DEAH box helicase [Methanocorpusculum sp.]|nr:DEAD/DEAH box helicase [Methanocorpusculum sp.]
MSYISHRNIPENTVEERKYQTAVARHALDGNTLVVLPTGMGKTAVALLVAAERLEKGKILMLAPTKPLVEQHLRYFSNNLRIESDDIVMFTGTMPSEKREKLWQTARFVTATPEVIKNDLIGGRYTLEDVSLLIVDECHRTTGDYAYVFIGERYNETARDPLLLAMTASPGSDRESVAQICEHLGITIVESRTEDDPDVRPYVHERELEYVTVELPEQLWLAVSVMNRMIDERIEKLRSYNYQVPPRERLSMKALNAVMAMIQMRMQQKDSSAYAASSTHAEIMKLRHGVLLAESQGSTALKVYLAKLEMEGVTGKSKAAKHVYEDDGFKRLLMLSAGWTKEIHPKADEVVRIVREQLMEAPESKIIVFVSFRDGVAMLVDRLTEAGIEARRFVGQASRDYEKGLSQKQQIAAIKEFREGAYPVLVSTSVGEEGLDIPSTDLVVFYESVPSEVRSIQRKGRTGRNTTGRVIVLVTKGTMDETYKYVSNSKEKAMHKNVQVMRNGAVPVFTPAVPPVLETPSDTQLSLAEAVLKAAELRKAEEEEEEEERPAVVVDNRETHSKVAECLSRLGVKITLAQLPVGDYAIGDRILVERKTIADFVDTLVERDLFGQMKELASNCTRPVLIVEGGSLSDLYDVRNVHPNAIRNTLASIAVDFDVSLVFTRDAAETADMLHAFARREAGSEKKERTQHKGKSRKSLHESAEYVLTAFPDVGPKAARTLLAHFGSLRAVLSASKEELLAVSGVGEKTAAGVCAVADYLWEKK